MRPVRLFGAPEHVIVARTYTDLQLRWSPRAGTQLSRDVHKAFDRDPPVSYNALNSYDPSYDEPGRFWTLSYRQKFWGLSIQLCNCG